MHMGPPQQAAAPTSYPVVPAANYLMPYSGFSLPSVSDASLDWGAPASAVTVNVGAQAWEGYDEIPEPDVPFVPAGKKK